MSRYNKLFKITKYKVDMNNNTYDSDDSDDIHSNVNNELFDSILRHPYIERMNGNGNEYGNNELNINSGNALKYLVIYRINIYNEVNPVVEFYILNDFLSTTSNITEFTNHELSVMIGEKRIKGTIQFKENNYLIIQVRNNADTSNWLNVWDILVNKHYFGNKICEHVIDFFYSHSDISNLWIGSNICIKPIILYTSIEEKYYEYIKKTKSIQYCQSNKESLIYLRNFKENDNIRTICFIHDRDIDDSLHTIEHNDYIIYKNNNNNNNNKETEWIFKNDNKMISFVK